MTISISVKSQNESLRDSIRTELNNLLPLSDYSLGEKLPDLGIEVIVEDVSFGFISNEKVEKLLKLLNSKDTQSSSIYISVIYVIYYYLWDHIIKEDEKLNTMKEFMFRISYDLEKDNKYSTGANGVYKHIVYHNTIVVKKNNLDEICKSLVSDFNDMVLTYINQLNSFSKYLDAVINKRQNN